MRLAHHTAEPRRSRVEARVQQLHHRHRPEGLLLRRRRLGRPRRRRRHRRRLRRVLLQALARALGLARRAAHEEVVPEAGAVVGVAGLRQRDGVATGCAGDGRRVRRVVVHEHERVLELGERVLRNIINPVDERVLVGLASFAAVRRGGVGGGHSGVDCRFSVQ